MQEEKTVSNMKKEQLRLYAVTDRTWLGNETLYEQVEKALRGGATLVQLREKDLPEADVQKEAEELLELSIAMACYLFWMMMWSWRQRLVQTGFISDNRIWNWHMRVRFSVRTKS